jgi:2-hydroxy-6-oxonona-2,4-dienedioate hydrolase
MALTEEGLVHVPGLHSRYVRLQSGVKAHYSTSGETGPDVILLHGGIPGSSGAAGFRHMAPFLGAHGFRVHAPDMPNFGLTEDPFGRYNYGKGAAVDFLHEFAEAIGLDTFHIGGNSMGCLNAVNYTVAHPERVRSFALIAGHIGDLVTRAEMLAANRGRKSEEVAATKVSSGYDGTAADMRRILENVTLDPAAVTDDVVEMRTAAAALHQDTYGPNMKRFLDETDPLDQVRLTTRGRLDVLDIPGIYVFGMEDSMYAPEAANLQEDALPKVQFFYPEDAGHQGQSDRPDLFNQLFLEFFRDGRVSWETATAGGVSQRRAPLPHLVEVPTHAEV